MTAVLKKETLSDFEETRGLVDGGRSGNSIQGGV